MDREKPQMVANDLEKQVEEMLDCLDIDIKHIEKNLAHLNEMRGLVIKRDDAALQKLLDCIQAESESYKEHESKRQMIRKKLADSLDCAVNNITLTMLGKKLPETKSILVREKRAHLKSLVEDFKTEYTSTIILLSECARFNKILIKSIFNAGKTDSVYYKANGTVSEHKEDDNSWLVNCGL
jgi:dGTP triphosphohydrolase